VPYARKGGVSAGWDLGIIDFGASIVLESAYVQLASVGGPCLEARLDFGFWKGEVYVVVDKAVNR
jgi:hypothetical protein